MFIKVAESIIGQNRIREIFRKLIIKDRLAHAYLITGPVGIGKRTLVKTLVAGILCSDGENIPCGHCSSCRLFHEGTHPEFFALTTDKNKIYVDEIREMQRDIHIRPLYSGKKVFIIEDGEKMTIQAQNALLKTLEEPPEYVCIIITAFNYEQLLPTIRSRAVRFYMEHYTEDEIKKVFSQKGIEYRSCYRSISGANVGSALLLASSEELNELRNDFLNSFLAFLKDKAGLTMDITNYLISNKDNTEYVLDILTSILRDALLFMLTRDENILINPDKKDIIIYIADTIEKKAIIDNIERCIDAKLSLERNANLKMTIDWLIISMV